MSNIGINVSRRIVGRNLDSDRTDETRAVRTRGPLPTLHKAVVVDVIYDPTILSEEFKQNLRLTVSNHELVEVLPVNSIVARMISNEEGLSSNSDLILFPFFSSHMMLPIKVGEVVHVIFEDYYARGRKLGYWMTRVHGDRAVEDANYSHLDRRFDPLNNLGNWSTAERSNVQSSPDPSFPNGAGTAGTNTLLPVSGGVNPYDFYLQNSPSTHFMNFEPVPRWNKRPGEYVLQGSNNTLIVLGEDRKGPVSGALSQETPDLIRQAGSIDIIAGRGRIQAQPLEEPEFTSPRTIRNSRGNLETDKAPWRNSNGGGRNKDNIREGDPDYTNDAARLLVSMQTKADDNFGITEIEYPSSTVPIVQPTNQANSGTFNHSYVLGKADHIRMIARKDAEREIEGSLLFLREGDASDGDEDRDLSFLWINKNGIQVEGRKIYLGTAAHENPDENDNINFNDDNGPYEPYILWSKYRDTVDSLQKQINDLREEHENSIKTFRNNLKQLLQQVQQQFQAGNNCPPYGPNPAITAAASIISSLATNLDTPVDNPLENATNKLSDEQDTNNKDNVSKVNHSQVIYGSKGSE